VRDDIGRTYVAGTVALPALSLTALQAAIAAAASSGVKLLEAAVVVTVDSDVDRGVLEGLGDPTVHVVAP
jgi:predicted anti-sigma-YlaC factor YlaD